MKGGGGPVETLYGHDFVSEDLERALQALTGDVVDDDVEHYRGRKSVIDPETFKKRSRSLERIKLRISDSFKALQPQMFAVCSSSSTLPTQPGTYKPQYEPQWTNEPSTHKVASTVARTLMRHAWLIPGEKIRDTQEFKFTLFTPRMTFDRSDETDGVGGKHINMFTVVEKYRPMWEAFGVRKSIDGITLISLLRSWSGNDDSGAQRFRTSVDHFKKVLRHAQRCIYRADQSNSDTAKALRAAFSDEALIWLPDAAVSEEELKKTVDGQFWRARDVVWNDPSGILDFAPGPPRVASLYYGGTQSYETQDLQNFFTSSMCPACIRGGYGAKGNADCEECRTVGDGREKRQREAAKVKGSDLPEHHFTCAGQGQGLVSYMGTIKQCKLLIFYFLPIVCLGL